MNKLELIKMIEADGVGLAEDDFRVGRDAAGEVTYARSRRYLHKWLPGHIFSDRGMITIQIEFDAEEDPPWYGDAFLEDDEGGLEPFDPGMANERVNTLQDAICLAESCADLYLEQLTEWGLDAIREGEGHIWENSIQLFLVRPEEEDEEVEA